MVAGKRKAVEGSEGVEEPSNVVEVIPLGAGQEVGRSCIIIKYMGKSVMLDCGIHPGFTGLNSLPFFDEINMAEVDAMLVTHFHLDHCAAVPYVVGHTSFKGRILMTHPTKAIFNTLLKDFVKVSKGSSDEGLYSEKDLEASLERVEVCDFHQTIDMDGIKVTAYRAGHVLGAAMFMVEIAGMRLLYTGDYSRVQDRHLSAADLPSEKPHIVIVESTYGVSNHEERAGREHAFVERVRQIVERGGRVLLPVVALGRAQELLLILDEFWEQNPRLHGVPIYQASGLARRAMSIYQTYIEMMNDDIKAAFQRANPFVFKHIQHLKSSSHFDDNSIGPCVVMATPSMLQSGMSRQLFEDWCEDRRNGVIIADFAVQGTLAREILGSPAEVMTRAGIKVPLRMSVDAISFSAHADYNQTSAFLNALAPPHVVLVHGEATEMGRLRVQLQKDAVTLGQTRAVYMPRVTQPVHIHHKAVRAAKVVGRLADKPAAEGAAVRGLLVRRAFADTIMHPDDLPTFTKLHPGRVLQRQALTSKKPFLQVRLALELMFEGVQGVGDICSVTGDGKREALRMADAVTVVRMPAGPGGAPEEHLVVEWEGGAASDMLADAVVAVILQTAGEPRGVSAAEERRRQAIHTGDMQAVADAEMHIVAALLSAQFGPARVDLEQGAVLLSAEEHSVVVDYKSGSVECADERLHNRVTKAIERLMAAMRPCALETAGN